MTEFIIILLIITVVVIGINYPSWRNRRITDRAFPESWRQILLDKLPFVEKLSAEEQRQLENNVKLFIANKKFHSCAGQVITDEIRVTIAAEACLLLLNRDTGVYPRLKHILVYPWAFQASHEQRNADGTVSDKGRGLLGESWHYGKVILSWDDIERGVRNFHDGHNVVLHEFSHQLDSESGSANGAPLLHTNTYATWASVLSKEFEELNEDFSHHHQSLFQ